MSDLKEFRNIADRVLCDMVADNALKEKVLSRCIKKPQVSFGKLLATAACFVLIIGVLNFSGLLQSEPEPEPDSNTEIFAVAEPGSDALAAGSQKSGINLSPAEVTTWELFSMEEAKTVFGSTLLLPSYIPAGFKLEKTYALGDMNTAHEVRMHYISEEQSFLIIESKAAVEEELKGYKKIEINGTEGYLRTEAAEGGSETEIRWLADGVHCSVSGQITGEEAVKIAEAME